MIEAQEPTHPFVGGETFLNTPAWQGVAKQLVHLAEFSGGIQVVDGFPGAGKTVFAHYVAGLFVEDICPGVIALPPGLGAEQVFACILSSLSLGELQGASVGAALIALRKCDTELKQSHLRKVLILDDAHRLDDQTLAALASLFQGDIDAESGLALLLVGEPGVATRLDALNLVDVEVRDCTLPALSLDEGRRLLSDEYQAVFPGKALPFSDSLIATIWHESGGLPGELLAVAHTEWAESADSASGWWRSPRVWQIGIPLLLFAAMIWGFLARDLWMGEDANPAGVGLQSEAPGKVFGEDVSNATDLEKINSKSADVNSQGLDQEAKAAASDEVVTAEEAAAEATVSEAVASQNSHVAAPQNNNTAASAIASKTLDSAMPPNQQEVVISTQQQSSSVASLAAVQPPIVQPSVQPPAAKQASKPATANKPDLAITPKPANKPTQKPQSPSVSARQELDGLTDDEAELIQRPRRGYVLQVLAAKSKESLQGFVRSQPNRSNLKIYRSLRSGKSWYVVVEGYYADKESAVSAMSNLPSSQLKSGPWPKSIGTVKLEITTFQQQSP